MPAGWRRKWAAYGRRGSYGSEDDKFPDSGISGRLWDGYPGDGYDGENADGYPGNSSIYSVYSSGTACVGRHEKRIF